MDEQQQAEVEVDEKAAAGAFRAIASVLGDGIVDVRHIRVPLSNVRRSNPDYNPRPDLPDGK
jgi:hypothetical protein